MPNYTLLKLLNSVTVLALTKSKSPVWTETCDSVFLSDGVKNKIGDIATDKFCVVWQVNTQPANIDKK